jgi:hypothetical protein
MWRSIFSAIGITLCILGAECLVVDEAVLAEPMAPRAPIVASYGTIGRGMQREIKTKEWMPWSFTIAGVVIIIYTFTLPRRFQP